MERFYYGAQICDFITDDSDAIIGKLASADSFDSTREQKDAWREEIHLLKDILHNHTGTIFFEYDIPRLGKRIDVILVINGIIFCLEFKVSANAYLTEDSEQVWDYALDLKNFHEPCRMLFLAPILIATDAPNHPIEFKTCNYDHKVYVPFWTNAKNLRPTLDLILENTIRQEPLDGFSWARGRYSPTPTIIQVASALYKHHKVENITQCDAGENLKVTTEYLLHVIEYAKTHHEKCICFVTGVPGAGKTLVGLNVAMKQFDKKEPAIYLSGNQPLVSVLTEALSRDKVQQEKAKGNKYTLKDARRSVNSFIQIIHHYRNNTLTKLKPIQNGNLEIDTTKIEKHDEDGYSEVEHVAIFDEAQRLWDKQMLASWLKRKKGITDFPMSESEFLIWSLDLRPDWAVVICLVGGGQEINTGEAGIIEPIRAINETFPHWKVYISPQLSEKEYAEGNIYHLLKDNHNVTTETALHLATSMRSFRAENLSLFVNKLLNCNIEKTRQIYQTFSKNYPILLTRNIETAKKWLRNVAGGSERYGLICSSQAYRLRPLAIDVRAKPSVENWFLDGIEDIRSSLFLEDVATEFDVQGLELDYTCLIWDGDLQYHKEKGWIQKEFRGGKWQNIHALERKKFQINAYRVLLTRARKGMIICIPKGDTGIPPDTTRHPEFYDSTYAYLKSIGLPEI